MSKITRKTAKIFGSTAGLNQIAEFGSLAAASPTFSTDPATIQSLSQWLNGWFSAVIGSNSPAIEDMNAFCYVMAYQIAYGFQSGVAEWDSGTTYYIGSFVTDGLGNLYYSIQDNNINNAVSNSSFWTLFSGSSSASNEILNLGLSNSVGSNAWTIALKQANGSSDPSIGTGAVIVGMRNPTSATGGYNIRSVSSALSLTISSGTTLNFSASTSYYVWVYLFDSDGSGTMKLGVSLPLYDDGSVINTVAESFTCTISNASPGVVTANGHGLNNSDIVQFTTTGSLPTGLSTGTNYYLVNKATNTFQVATVPGGTAINTSSAGSGVHTVHVVTANGQIISNGVFTGVAFRAIGRMLISETTPGTWTATATEVTLAHSTDFFSSKATNINCFHYLTISGNPGANAVVVFDTKVFDTLNMYSNSNGYMVIPRTGKYRIGQCGQFTSGTAGIYLSKNGTSFVNIGQWNGGIQNSGTGMFSANAGDFLFVSIDSGHTIAASGTPGSGDGYSTYFSLENVGS